MTEKQKDQFNEMLETLRAIANGYLSPGKLRKQSGKWGLEPDEALEMSYENMQNDAKNCIKGIRYIKDATRKHA